MIIKRLSSADVTLHPEAHRIIAEVVAEGGTGLAAAIHAEAKRRAQPKPRTFIRAVNGRPVESMVPAAERAEWKGKP